MFYVFARRSLKFAFKLRLQVENMQYSLLRPHRRITLVVVDVFRSRSSNIAGIRIDDSNCRQGIRRDCTGDAEPFFPHSTILLCVCVCVNV